MSAEVLSINSQAGMAAVYGGARPIVNDSNNEAQIRTPRGLTVNSLLTKIEWTEIDAAVIAAAVPNLPVLDMLRRHGLTQRLGGLGTLVSQWTVAGEMTAATINLTGQGKGENDLPESNVAGVPVPVIFKEFSIGARTLDASRRLGDGLDTTAAVAAARVVAESIESLIIDGSTNISLNGSIIYGLTSEAQRNTDTAANYGGGDWGTLSNVTPTIAGMIAAASADNFYGPFGLLVYPTQYYQASMGFYTDGSGQTALQRITGMLGPGSEVQMCPSLAAGEVVLFSLNRSVIDWAEALPMQTLEWASGDGMVSHFKIMAVGAPRVKNNGTSKSGIVHATAA
jgi:uncharacterized linocin/CFP29 family protein